MIKLQRLRIPGAKMVMWNKFYELEPNELDYESEFWKYFSEDMLYVTSARCGCSTNKYILDLGWYPEGDPKGTFILYIIENDNWLKPREVYESRILSDITLKIEEYLEKYT